MQVLEWKTMDSIYFSFLFLFSFIFIFLFGTQGQGQCDVTCYGHMSHNHMTWRRLQKILEQIILYNIVIVCWPCKKHMDLRIGQLQYVYRLQSMIYKVGQFVTETSSSSLALYQVWFALEGESPWSWLGHIQSVEASCNELGDADLPE